MVDFDPNNLNPILRASQNFYWKHMVKNGRPLAEPDSSDLDCDGNVDEQVTYSESVAYSLKRAALLGGEEDQKVFKEVWSWAQKNMQRKNIENWWTCTEANITFGGERGETRGCRKEHWTPEPMPEEYKDHLLAWRYVSTLNGENSPGGIINFKAFAGEGDRNGYSAASDDLEIATALYIAYLRGWGNEYLKDARDILDDAWKKYVIEVDGKFILTAGDQFAASGGINPSYFRPAQFSRIFPAIEASKPVDQIKNPWHEITKTSYEIIHQSGNPNLVLNGHSGAGVNLPSDWLDIGYDGKLTESSLFPELAGENFGWDAYRTLYAVAEDYQWYGTPSAKTYLTDCNVGPLCFLSGKLGPGGKIQSGFSHDGKPVKVKKDIKQTRALNRDQLAFYGGYLPFFHAAGGESAEKAILARLSRSTGCNTDGCWWGDDPINYYTQNWVWFGLMSIHNNGLPVGLEAEIRDLPAPREIDTKAVTRGWHLPLLSEVDYEIGYKKASDSRPILRRKSVEKKLTLEQMRAAVKTLVDHPYDPFDKEKAKSFAVQGEIYKLDKKYPYKLLGYFGDPLEYWNNAIILLSVYIQKLTEEDKKEEFESAIRVCQEFRNRIAAQKAQLAKDLPRQKMFMPNTYQEATLEITEAEVRSQVKYQDLSFYQTGIEQAVKGINLLLAVDRKESRPDYHQIARILLTIGDLYLRMYDVTRDLSYMDKATAFFSYVENIDHEKPAYKATVSAPDPGVERLPDIKLVDVETFIRNLNGGTFASSAEGILLETTPQIIDNAIAFNYRKGHLDPEQMADSKMASPYLKGIAMVKNISVFIQKTEKKHYSEILDQISKCDEAIRIIEEANQGKTEPDFFAYFAKNVKADLLMALMDQIKFDPKILTDLKVELKLEKPEDTEELLALTAKELYSNTPSKFLFLYAWSQTKLTEIAIRSADFINKEFKYLYPFHTKPLSGQNPIPGKEFLGVQLDYQQALLFISTAGKGIIGKKGKSKELTSRQKKDLDKAAVLLNGVVKNSQHLAHPLYRRYFKLLAELKLFEIDIRYKKFKTKEEFEKMEARLNQLEKDVKSFDAEQLEQMTWNPNSFLAELYHEWANVLRAKKKVDAKERYACMTLDHSLKSDSPYDRTRRIEEVGQEFDINVKEIEKECKGKR